MDMRAIRPRLGLGLQDIVMGQQPAGMPPIGPAMGMPPVGGPPIAAQPQAKPEQQGGLFREGGMGRHLAGVIGDALMQRAGMAPAYSPMMEQRQAEKASEAQWHRSREAQQADRAQSRQWENEDWQARQAYERANPAPSPMQRDAMAWQNMTPEQRTAYTEARSAGAGSEFVTVTLPNGQFYAGPRAGLPEALRGSAAQAPAQAPDRLPADFDFGGSGGNATGGF